MEFTFSDEQEMFRASVREFVADRVPAERLAEIADGSGWDEALWKEAASMGLAAVSVPEEHGGAGMGFVEEAIVAEELGRGVFPGPFLGTVVLAQPALERTPDLLGEVASGARTATLAWAADGRFDPEDAGAEAEGDGDRWTVRGEARHVPDLEAADLVVVAARAEGGVGLWAVDRDETEWERLPTVDRTRRLGRVAFRGAPGRLLAPPAEGTEVLRRTRDRALALLAAEAVGVASRAVELAVEHAGTREQFGKPVGAFQAVSHQVADAFVDAENARSLAYWAAAALASGTEDAPVAAATAKSFAAEAAERACERSIQVHGGIGFTWEHVLHRYCKRALWIASFLGTPADLRARVARHLLR